MNEEELEEIQDNFDTSTILEAVGSIDELRKYLNDRDFNKPPELRDRLLKLHDLADKVINNGWTGQAEEMFELAGELEGDVLDMLEELEKVQLTLSNLVNLYPSSLDDDFEDD